MARSGYRMNISDFDYVLPQALIAQEPPDSRGNSQLVSVDRSSGQIQHHPFSYLLDILSPGDLIVVNDTEVLPARLQGKKPTGGKIEVMLERIESAHVALVQLRSNKSLKHGQQIVIDKYTATITGRLDRFYQLTFSDGVDAKAVFQAVGAIPLPPYIQRLPVPADNDRYQTVFAKNLGAVAAPTAGLHFNQSLIDQLADKGIEWANITLHVGAGTFLPVQVEQIEDHVMHSERVSVGQEVCDKINAVKQRGGRIVAVGTTVMRALESAAKQSSDGKTLEPMEGDTALYITPGFEFSVIDLLITNFHLPKSSLLILVSAFAGSEEIKNIYQYAITHKLKFFSYGDAMILERNDDL